MGQTNLCADAASWIARIWALFVANLTLISLENTCNVGLMNVVFLM